MKELKNKFMRLNKYLTLVSINYYELNKLKLLVDDKKVLKKMELLKNKLAILDKISLKKLNQERSLNDCEELLNEIIDVVPPMNLLDYLTYKNLQWDFKLDCVKEHEFYYQFFNLISVIEVSNGVQKKNRSVSESNVKENKKEDKKEEENTKLEKMNPFLNPEIPYFLLDQFQNLLSQPLIPKNKKKIYQYDKLLDELNSNNENTNLKLIDDEGKNAFERTHCAVLLYHIDNKIYYLRGYFKEDILNLVFQQEFLRPKYLDLKYVCNFELVLVPEYFKDKLLKMVSIKDFILETNQGLALDIKKKYNQFKLLQNKPLLSLINQFILSPNIKKIDILTLLLIGNDENKKLAFILYDVLRTKAKDNSAEEIIQNLHPLVRNELDIGEELQKETEEKLTKLTESDIPYEKRIALLNSNEDVKSKAMDKLKGMKSSFQGDNKAQAWLDGLLRIPFSIYKDTPIITNRDEFIKKISIKYPGGNFKSDVKISHFLKNHQDEELNTEWTDYLEKRSMYIKDVRKVLDEAVYGHDEAKSQLEKIIGQWLNGESKGAVLGLEGPPGTGKTSLAKSGLSKCLKDSDGNPRPFSFLAIGGSANGSTLVGHNYTYVGSIWGKIVDILMTTQCMNPIIFIDEIDKVSRTEHGKEIISILTHLTDSTQNDEFEDKYFAGINFDLSKCLIVFSYNDASLIDPILRDRITTIKTNPLSVSEKINIVNGYMMPQILKDVGFDKDDVVIDNQVIKELIESYTLEAGVRKLKEKLIELVREINLKKIYGEITQFPFTIDKEYVKDYFLGKPKVRFGMIPKHPQVGFVNGLYASASGIGGLTTIEVVKVNGKPFLEMECTGNQGDVMKESIKVAKTNAWSLIDKETQDKLIKENKESSFGLHLHTPEGGTPKDGPSAGAALTLAIYSILTDKKVDNKIAMTGETDLSKNVKAIGGLLAKLNGAKKAGATRALIPKENEEDWEDICRRGLDMTDENFKVIMVETIDEVLKLALIY